MEFDALALARFQFAFTVTFHIVFPAFSIGLASYLAVLEGLWLVTGRQVFLELFDYWKRIFAVAFGMGVVSGLVMSYQFGTNWSVFSDKTGPVLGPLMGYEVLTAFFLEAGFLGVMLFGMSRVGRSLHFFATLMVAAGTLISAFWILECQQLDADAGRIRDERGRTVRGQGLVGGDLQPVVSLPSRPHGAGSIPDDGVRGRGGGRVASAGRSAQRGRARDVLDGDVDGDHSGADAGRQPATRMASTLSRISRPRSRRWRDISTPGRGRR